MNRVQFMEQLKKTAFLISLRRKDKRLLSIMRVTLMMPEKIRRQK